MCLKDASKISGYNQDYLGYLIRTGKLKGDKVGRSWMTTKVDLDNFLHAKSDLSLSRFLYSRIGLTTVIGLGLSLIVGFTFFVSVQVSGAGQKASSASAVDQLNLSSVDSNPIIGK